MGFPFSVGHFSSVSCSATKRISQHLFLALVAMVSAVSASVATLPSALAETPQGEALSITLPPVLLKMSRDSAVHRELGLSAQQVDEVTSALKKVDGDWFRARNVPADRQRAELTRLSALLRSDLESTLTTDQLKRLSQLQFQALGTRMVLHPEAAETLGITAEQTEKFVRLFRATDQVVAEANNKQVDGADAIKQAAADVAEAQSNERKQVVAILTSKQSGMLGTVAGKPFDFSVVKRTYPMAPELSTEGATWLVGSPVKLEDLRGKVVALHFYAFQCINCRRNLPHYEKWHNELADEGLVVIGIQRPETSAERDPDRVLAAAKADSMDYNVLMDAQSSNWNAWHNTMWPTVYLIDKKGYLRRWWQGEMNWKGTPGEEQMRQTIRQLLAEND